MRLRSLIIALCFVGLLALPGCTPKPQPPSSPLGTSGTVAPPPACVDLRKRGGSC